MAQDTEQLESRVNAFAVQAGPDQRGREQLLGRYLRGQVSRQEAIEEIGIDWVDLAERQQQAVLEDMEWALTPPDKQ